MQRLAYASGYEHRQCLAVIDEQMCPLWDQWWKIYTLIGLLVFEWIFRRTVKLS